MELSELQAVDFAVGGYILAAFNGHAASGPKEWQEFCLRPGAKKVYRNDAENPSTFLKALSSGRKSETTAGTIHKGTHDLPVAYYFRKPGFTNSEDRKRLAGRHSWNDALTRAYDIEVLPIYLDYRMTFCAFDKLTLDKMMLAWYAYQMKNEKFSVQYHLGQDNFDVNAFVLDHKTVTMTDTSEPIENGRLYAVEATISVYTQVIFGAEATPPAISRIVGSLGHTLEKYTLAFADGTYTFDPMALFGKAMPLIAGSIMVYCGEDFLVDDDGEGGFGAITGAVNYETGLITIDFDCVGGNVSVLFVENNGGGIIGISCPSCHRY